jgi:hypothetical protein
LCQPDVEAVVRLPFSGLSPLVIDEVKDEGELIRVRARTPAGPVACPDCGTATARVHGYHERTVTDIALDARQVVLKVRVRRLVCPTYGCRRTFREQVPGVVERYQRRTSRLTAQIGAVVKELAGRAGVRVLSALGAPVSRHTALRVLMRLPLPVRPVPQVLGVDLSRGRYYPDVVVGRGGRPWGGGLRVRGDGQPVGIIAAAAASLSLLERGAPERRRFDGEGVLRSGRRPAFGRGRRLPVLFGGCRFLAEGGQRANGLTWPAQCLACSSRTSGRRVDLG